MSSIQVMVVESHCDILAKVVAEAIRNAPDFTLVGDAVVSVDEAYRLLSTVSDDIKVVVVVGDDSGLKSSELLARHPGMLVSNIVIRPDIVHLDLKRIGLNQLLSTLRALVPVEQTSTAHCLEYEVVAKRSIVDDESCEVVEVDHGEKELWKLAIAWIDAVLQLRLENVAPSADSIPGLTRGPDSIRHALSASHPGGAAKDEKLDAVSAATGALREALTRTRHASHGLATFYRNLGLSFLELQALLLCVAPELDSKYQSVYGYLQDDLGRRAASLGLVCSLIGDSTVVRRQLGQAAGLVRWRLLDHRALLPCADEAMRLEPVLVDWLLGDEQALSRDLATRRLARAEPWVGGRWLRRAADVSLSQRLSHLFTREDCRAEWLVLAGEDADGWRALLEGAVAQTRRAPLRIAVVALTGMDAASAADAALRIARAVRLLRATPVLDATGCGNVEHGPEVLSLILDALGEIDGTGVVITDDLENMLPSLPRARCRVLQRQRPDGKTIGASFIAAAAESGLQVSEAEAYRIGTSFPLSLVAIDAAVRLAVSQGAALLAPERHVAALTDSGRRVAAPNLPKFARRIEPVVEIGDVVLPADRSAQLIEIATHVEQAAKVIGSWGFGVRRNNSRGVAVLFCGPSGTGKTMAAQAVARRLSTHLYQVDLSKVQSKYIGESEKHLDAVFREAERADAVLLFDEADALFGKRSEVKDAHDRYANMEVAYLLQRIEEFGGLAILTTNFRQNLDQAFLRRLRFVIEFPKPDAQAREVIWQQCLPAEAPRGADIDFKFLARRLELTGGSIAQITLRAAFAAAEGRAPAIGMQHIIAATRAELLKIGMPNAERDLAEYEAARQQEFKAA